MSLGRAIRQMKFDAIFDLDASRRSAGLRRWAWPSRAAWSVTSRNSRIPLPDRHTAQLKADGDGRMRRWTAAWRLTGHGLGFRPEASRPSLRRRKTPPLCAVRAGRAENRRWPTAHFGAIAEAFRGQGFDVAILGQPEDSTLARQIQKLDRARDLTGRTDYAVIALPGLPGGLGHRP